MIIAIDGPAASGKGTLGKRLAAHYGLRHLDTGLLYRAVAQALRAAGHRLDDAACGRRRRPTRSIPPPSTRPRSRAMRPAKPPPSFRRFPRSGPRFSQLQRGFAATPPGAVLDGRDIGTVICPDADVKIYVTASPEVRARRRMLEMRNQGQEADEAAILADIRRRDQRDTARAVAPLKPAPDAHILDTSDLDIEAVVGAAIAIVEAARPASGRNRRIPPAKRRDARTSGNRRRADPQLFSFCGPASLAGAWALRYIPAARARR